jgi:hypothetical protein
MFRLAVEYLACRHFGLEFSIWRMIFIFIFIGDIFLSIVAYPCNHRFYLLAMRSNLSYFNDSLIPSIVNHQLPWWRLLDALVSIVLDAATHSAACLPSRLGPAFLSKLVVGHGACVGHRSRSHLLPV